MTNDVAVTLLNMSVFEKEKHCIFQGTVFYIYMYVKTNDVYFQGTKLA